MNKRLRVVTGGNSGIGYATAQLFKAQGDEVIITGRSIEKVTQAAQDLGVRGMVADVQDLASIDRLVSDIDTEFGQVDSLFVNAGVFQPTPLGQLSEESFDYQMNINLKGAIFTVEKFLPIIKDGGSITNLSSINAYTGMPNTAVYAATKAALNSFTRTAATELAPRKIRVNAVNPGPVSTPIFSKTGMPDDQLSELASSMQDRIPLKRFGEPSEVAHLVSFLSSEQASFINGSEINIDGGMNINPLIA